MSEEKKKKAPVERKIVSAGNEKSVKKTETKFKDAPPSRGGNAMGFRIGAIVCWLLGIACEVFAILVLNGTFSFVNPAAGTDNTLMALIIPLVVDAIFVIIGSQLWKKANDIAPASKKNKIKFFLWNNMGLIASIVAFLPIIILFLLNKDLDKKTKNIVTAVALVVLVIAGASSIDYNPTSQEDLAQAQVAAEAAGIASVYWTPFGSKYHVDPDCQSLLRSGTIYTGTIQQAFEANRNSPCSFCAVDFANTIANVDVENLPTGEDAAQDLAEDADAAEEIDVTQEGEEDVQDAA